jgi:glutamate-5-semialdehyde dehydrogenase
MRRTSVCGATETLLIDRAIAGTLLPPIADALRQAGCALRGDEAARAIVAMNEATEEDWHTEYLAPILSVRVVSGVADAIAHIARYGSQHTEAIVTEDVAAAARFLHEVDSAIVLHNASTQFADGGEFGFGGEIGIATGRLHARGPVGAEQLTTFKYVIHGDGQIRS